MRSSLTLSPEGQYLDVKALTFSEYEASSHDRDTLRDIGACVNIEHCSTAAFTFTVRLQVKPLISRGFTINDAITGIND